MSWHEPEGLTMRPQPRPRAMFNLLTDISGIRVGNAYDTTLISGVTAIVFD